MTETTRNERQRERCRMSECRWDYEADVEVVEKALNDAELVANWMTDYAERTHSIGAQGLLRKAVTLLNRHVALNRDDAPEPDSGEKQ